MVKRCPREPCPNGWCTMESGNLASARSLYDGTFIAEIWTAGISGAVRGVLPRMGAIGRSVRLRYKQARHQKVLNKSAGTDKKL